jgi:heptosyltransferase-1
MRVLIVRLSSMGDLVQTLPALSDAARTYPAIRFDWAVDESFAQVPTWHRNVENVFASAFRRWGGGMIGAVRDGEIGSFLKALRANRYDAIVDVQGEWKSATIALAARGPKRGYDATSIHEWGAHLLYGRRLPVSKGQHSIQRMRQLLAQALDYSYSDCEVDYGVDPSRLVDSAFQTSRPYAVFIHSTSWESKCWPEGYWTELRSLAVNAGYHVVLPWGTGAERERAERIAGAEQQATVLPRLSIAEKAAIISRAAFTVGLDTGLSHIAAAFDIPSVTIYGATDPLLVGATGKNQIHLASDFECVKCHEVICSYSQPTPLKPACFVKISPVRVWQEVMDLLARG